MLISIEKLKSISKCYLLKEKEPKKNHRAQIFCQCILMHSLWPSSEFLFYFLIPILVFSERKISSASFASELTRHIHQGGYKQSLLRDSEEIENLVKCRNSKKVQTAERKHKHSQTKFAYSLEISLHGVDHPSLLPPLIRTLKYRNADALKNALVEEGLGRVYGVCGGNIKLSMCCVRKRQREVSSYHGFIQRNSLEKRCF